MSCELINPRTDAPRVMRQLYEALKNKPCECKWAWRDGHYGVANECAGHKAMAAYEAIAAVLT